MATPYTFDPGPYLRGLMSGASARPAVEDERNAANKSLRAAYNLSRAFGGNNVVNSGQGSMWDLAIQRNAMRDAMRDDGKAAVDARRAMQEMEAQDPRFRTIGGRKFAFDKEGRPVGFSGGAPVAGIPKVPEAGFTSGEQSSFDKVINDALTGAVQLEGRFPLNEVGGTARTLGAPGKAPMPTLASLTNSSMAEAPGPRRHLGVPLPANMGNVAKPANKWAMDAMMGGRQAPVTSGAAVADRDLLRAERQAPIVERLEEAQVVAGEQSDLRTQAEILEAAIRSGMKFDQTPLTGKEKIEWIKRRDELKKQIADLESKRVKTEQGE